MNRWRRLLQWIFNTAPLVAPAVTPDDHVDDEIVRRREREDALMDEIRARLESARELVEQRRDTL